MADRIQQIFEIDDSQAIQALERILELTENASRKFEDLDDDQKETFQQLAQSLGIAESEFNDLIRATGNYESEIKKSSRATDDFKKGVKDAVREVRIFGVSVGEAVDFLQSKAKALRAVVTGLGASSKALRIFRAALISTGIGAIVVAFGSLVTLLTKTQRGIDFVNRVLAVMGSIVDNVIERLAILGEAVVQFVSGNFGQSFRTAQRAAAGFGAEVIKDAKAADQLEVASQRLADRQRELSVEFARTRQRIEELRLIAQDETKSRQEQQNALKEAIRLEEQIGNQRIELAEEELRIVRERNALGESLREDLEAEAALEAEIAQIRGEVARRQRELTRRQTTISRQSQAEAESQLKALEKQREEIEKLAEEERKRAQELISQLRDLEAEAGGPEAIAKRQLDIALQSVERLKQRFDELKESGLLDNVDVDFDSLFRNAFEKYEQAIAKINGEEVEPIIIDDIEIEEPDLTPIKRGLEQLTEDQKKFIQSQLSSAINSITELFLEGTKSQIDAQQAVIDKRQEAIDQLESQLAQEERLKEQGFANNAASVEAALKEETRILQQEEQKRLELEKKAARERLIINSLLQVSETVTAVARLLNQGAKGFLPGLIIAAGAVALLFNILAKTRSQAQQFAQVPQFREGTPELIGPSHERGGILLEAEGGERIISKRLNAELGGRKVSNDELVETYRMGIQAKDFMGANPYTLPSILKSIRENEAAANEMKLDQHTRRLEAAYNTASEKAANKMIEYWKTRPVTKPTAKGETTEWWEGRTFRKVNIETKEEKK